MDLADRMKQYEFVSRNYLTDRVPIIIRIDGKAFHTFTKGFEKPFDKVLSTAMRNTMIRLCKEIQDCAIGYCQSDEISLLLLNNAKQNSERWFNNNLSKITSISSSLATLYFNEEFIKANKDNKEIYNKKYFNAVFDSRAFNLPKEEICNYFIWRQQDCIRNSINMVARSLFSHKELMNLKCENIKLKLLNEKNINFEEDYISFDRLRNFCN